MAFLGMGNDGFDASQIDPSRPRDILPPEWYKAIIDASDVKPTKKATEAQQYGGEGANDRLLALTFRVIDGEYEGANIFTNLNIVNTNPKAMEIAQSDFSAICHAIGKLKVKDSSELHNKPMLIKVDVEKKEGYSARNIIKGYKSISEATGGAATQAAGTAAKVAAKPAWSQK